MNKIIIEEYMFEGGSFSCWEDILDTLGVDPVRINPLIDPDDLEYPKKVELTVTETRVL